MDQCDIAGGRAKLIADTRPCFVSFIPFYLPSVFTLLIVIGFLIRKTQIIGKLPESFRADIGLVFIYLLLGMILLVPALIYSFSRLTPRYLAVVVLGLVVAISVKHFILRQPWKVRPDSFWLLENSELLLIAGFACLSIAYIEEYRRSHHYLVTEECIQIRSGILSRKERMLPLTKIDDLSVVQCLTGRIFGFSSIVPITASGRGLGLNFAAFSGSISGKKSRLPAIGLSLAGGHGRQALKLSTYDALYGVCDELDIARKIMDIIGRKDRQS